MKWDNVDELVQTLKSVGNLGKKMSEKILFRLISNKEKLNELSTLLNKLNSNYAICEVCFFLKEQGSCLICADEFRVQTTICVVPTISEALNIERMNSYKGLYHILGGEIALNKLVAPENLKISELFNRIKNNEEIILALNGTIEGEVTAIYINNIAQTKNVKISRLAQGVPIGGFIDYLDEFTLNTAFKNRKEMK